MDISSLDIRRRVIDTDCDSQAEFSFAHEFQKYSRIELIQQYEINGYRVDFKINDVAVEIDGKKYHDYESDIVRDKRIIGDDIKSIIRFKAENSFFNPSFCAWFVLNYMNEPLNRITKKWWLQSIQSNPKSLIPKIGNYMGYKSHTYTVDDLMPDKEREYYYDLECNYENEIDILDYTFKKDITILTLSKNQ